MSDEQLAKLVRAAAKAGSSDNGKFEVERAVEALNELKKFSVTKELLCKTKAGKEVRKLAKSKNEQILAAAKEVIDVWKEKIYEEHQKPRLERRRQLSSPFLNNDHPPEKTSYDTKQSDPTRAKSDVEMLKSCSTASSDGVRTENRVRDVVVNKLTEFLMKEEKEMSEVRVTSKEAAVEIEQAMVDEYGDPGNENYRSKFRTLQHNLKDHKNGTLRKRILMRDLSGIELISLSSEELANDELKRQNSDIRKKQLLECERAVPAGATTDSFTCGKCKQNKCTYSQMQTRSADEPMTTYVTCMNCGHRWKF